MAGGDVNAPTYQVITPAIQRSINGFAKLVEKYNNETDEGRQIRELIERLQYFSEYVPNEIRRTLEEKMTAGHRQESIRFATQMKERFAKKIAKHQFSESAQEIHAYLLAEVLTRFNQHIACHIADGAPKALINDLLQKHVIDPLLDIVAESPLQHYSDDVFGMVYFLTGNCHIKWDK